MKKSKEIIRSNSKKSKEIIKITFLFRGVAGDAGGSYAAGSYFAFFFTTRRTVFTTFLAGAGLGA